MTQHFTSPPRKRESGDGRLDSRFRGNDGLKKRALVIGVVLAAMTLAGCGKKGPPGPPPGVPNTYPQNYPQQ
jgi:predicted small lipoprotein YifL